MAGSFRVAVVTPEREVLAVEAKFVALPTFDGEMGILPRRAALLVQLGSGVLRVDGTAGEHHRLFVSGGFAQMVEDRLTVLTEEAVDPEKLSGETANESLATAQSLPSASDEAWSRKQHQQSRARAILRLTR